MCEARVNEPALNYGALNHGRERYFLPLRPTVDTPYANGATGPDSAAFIYANLGAWPLVQGLNTFFLVVHFSRWEIRGLVKG